MRFNGRSILVITALCGAPLPALAQADYPNKPITLIVPFPPGGVTDIAGREVARNLTKYLNQAVVVENKAGAGGNIGTQYLSVITPDGYTL